MPRLLVVAVLALGCATTLGRPIPWDEVARLEPGISTLEDAKRILGPPDVVEVKKDHTVFGWTHARVGPTGGKSEALTLAFGLDGNLLGKPPPADAVR